MIETIEIRQDDEAHPGLYAEMLLLVGIALLVVMTVVNVAKAWRSDQLDISSVEDCRQHNAQNEGIWVWDFRYGCQMLRAD